MAYFHEGFVFEFIGNRLTIEGVPVDGVVDRECVDAHASGDESVLVQRVCAYIDGSKFRAARERTKRAHLKILRDGTDAWNAWRSKNRRIMPMLANHDFTRDKRDRSLDGCDFSYANLTQANLQEVSLKGATFHQAILAKANLSGAHLQKANFCRTDFYETNFEGASLAGANLQGVQLVRANLQGTDVRKCQVYGLAAWDLELSPTTRQEGLVIHYEELVGGERHPRRATVHSIDLASFMYLTLNNKNIARVIEAATKQWVLLLGRFTERKEMLNELAKALKARDRIPIVFDFERAKQRDLVETIVLLAGLSGLVIVDITDPRSTPLELHAIVPNFAVPVVPIMQQETTPFGVFSGLLKFPWVQTAIPYVDTKDLIKRLNTSILGPANAEERRQTALRTAAHAPGTTWRRVALSIVEGRRRGPTSSHGVSYAAT